MSPSVWGRPACWSGSIDGRASGFKLFVRPGSRLEHVGLQSLDVITGINEVEIGSPSTLLELFEQLKTATRVTVQYERAGRREAIEFTVNR